MTDSLEAIALRPSIIRENWLPLKMAVQEVLAFEQRFGKRHLLLACHAALPSYLTPELLNLVRLNFLDDENIAAIAEADFLLSPLCRPVDERLFEVEPAVREVLLVSLKRQYGKAEGEKRLVDLAAFLRRYLAEKSHQITRPDVLNTMRWIASSYLEPDFVVQELRKQLDESLSNTENVNEALVEQAELVVLLEKIAEPLERSPMQQEYQYLMHDSHVVAQILYTDEPTDEMFAASEKDTHAGDLSNLISPTLLKWIAVSALSVVAVGSLIWLANKGKAGVKNVIESPQSVLPATIASEVERLLSLASWTIQDYASADIRAERGVAIRNFPIRLDIDETQFVDYLLFVDQQAVSTILVMGEVEDIINTEKPISLGIGTPTLNGEKPRRNPLPFNYETNMQGTHVRFTNYLDPVSHTRSVFAFHRPETLSLWLQQAPMNVGKSQTNLLRAQLRRMPPLSREGLWNHQYEAITNLEKSLAENRQRSLIQLPTGSGKAYMMVSSIYRLMTSGNARRILYLTNEDARAKYVYDEFQSYHIPGESLFPSPTTFPSSTTFSSGGTFLELYNVQFTSTLSSPNVNVQISPIQSLAPQLFRESTLSQYHTELSAHSEDWQAFGKKPIRRIIELLTNIQDMLIDIFDSDQLEDATYLTDEQRDMIRDLLSESLDLGKLTPEILADYVELIGELLLHGVDVSRRTMQYSPALPIDAFDIIIIDECTRHIIDQSQLRSVLEYFDAFLIGLTEEADPRVVSFFNNNVVYKQLPDLIASITLTHQVNICIFCVLSEEAQALKEAFKETLVSGNFQQLYSARLNRNYDYITITNVDGAQLGVLVTWPSNAGPVDVKQQLHSLVEEFDPSFVAMIGICAGDKEKVKLGDIIVADRVFLYDTEKMIREKDGHLALSYDTQMWSSPTEVIQAVRSFNSWKTLVAAEQGKRPISKRQQRDWLLNILFEQPKLRIDINDISLELLNQHAPDWKKLIRELQEGSDAYLTQDMRLHHKKVATLLHEKEDFPFKDPEQPTVYIAPIASESATRAANAFDEIRLPVQGVVAIDMEGAAFYSTMREFNKTHYLLVKGVSDYTDGDKDDSYREYAAKVSALYLLAFLRQYVVAERMHLAASIIPPSLPIKEDAQQGLNLFYCYAPEDKGICLKLEKHLSIMRRQNLIKSFTGYDIKGGEEADKAQKEIERHLKSARIILLMVSSDLLGSDDLYEKQIKPALDRRKNDENIRVIPILAQPIEAWEQAEFGRYQPLPLNKKPIASWRNIDEALSEVAKGIRGVVEDMRKG